ncbi:hypothetical protein [Clostridium cavendishii]|nr:hypothetical protein [Clostridium cavendishii]
MFNFLFTIFILRYIALLSYVVVDKQTLIGYLKYLNYLDFIYVPMMLITCFYIFLRDNKINFSIEYIILTVFSFLYIVGIYFTEPYLKLSTKYGYIINLKGQVLYNFVGTSIIILIFILIVAKIDNELVNKNGMSILLIGAIFIIVQNITMILNIEYIPNRILGDLILLFLCNYSIKSFKR